MRLYTSRQRNAPLGIEFACDQLASEKAFIACEARHNVGFGMAGSGALAARRRLETGPTVRAAMFHRFGDSTRDP